MVAGCGMRALKCTVFTVNLILLILAVAALAGGFIALMGEHMPILTQIDSRGRLTELKSVFSIQAIAIILIVVGVFLLIVGVLGCFGAAKEIKAFLIAYVIVVSLILIVECVLIATAIVFRKRIKQFLRRGLEEAVKEKYEGNLTSQNQFSRAFDFVQVYFQCCGVSGPKDFLDSPWYRQRGQKEVPDTCCQLSDRDRFFRDKMPFLQDDNCPLKGPGTDNPHTTTPCYDRIENWAERNALTIIGCTAGMVLIEILAVIFGCQLCRAICSANE